MKKLIVTADDFGLTTRVNEAIALACRRGVVTTASLMVTGAGFESAVDLARNTPGLDLGLHLNLTEGKPVSSWTTVPSLADSSGFTYPHPSKLAAALIFGKVRVSDLEREIRSQIEKAVSTGLRITHVDGHKHVHAMPAVFRLMRSIAPEYSICGVRCAKETVPSLRTILARNKGSWSQIALQFGFGKVLSATWTMSSAGHRTFQVVTPQRFYGVTQTGFLDIHAFEEILHDLSDGFSEVMCHPGYSDGDLKRTPTRLRAQRERELELLTSCQLRDLIHRKGVTLGSYRDLVENGQGGAAAEFKPRQQTGVLMSKR
jgi:hopanoid biosynthesis associated protein HpnK